MKTKYLFMSMVLPAVLAACSNDDFVEKTTISTTDDGRALVGDVVLKTTFPEDASTVFVVVLDLRVRESRSFWKQDRACLGLCFQKGGNT